MRFIDTHTHIYLTEFDTDRDEVIKRADSFGITKLLLPNIDIESVGQMLDTVENYPAICYPMIGLHPTSVKENYLIQLHELNEIFPRYNFIAIGEIGIDLFWDKTYIREQMEAFRLQVSFAIEKGLPVAIHSRNAFPELFEVLEEFRGKGIKGVLHAFSGTIADAEKAIVMGLKLGIGGVLTYKNSGLDKIVYDIGIKNIIFETDSPYLAPVPYRGKRNESSYIYIINKKLATIFGISEEVTASEVYSTTVSLFNLKEEK